MNGADIAILLVLAVSSLLSLMRGLVREILSLVSWVVSVWVAFHFCGAAGGLMGSTIAEGPLRTGVAFVALMVGSLVVLGLFGALLAKAVAASGLGSTDKVLGMWFGFLRGLAILVVLVLLAGLTPLPQQDWWQSSLLLPRLVPLAQWALGFMPPPLAGYFGYHTPTGA